MHHEDARLRRFALVAIGVAVELAGDVGVQARVKRLVESFNGSDNIVVGGIAVLRLHLLQSRERFGDRVALLPLGLGDALT